MTNPKRKKLVHIYPASGGNNVLYISTIIKALESNFEQVAFVSSVSPLKQKSLKRWLHPFTDRFKATGHITGLIRYPIRFIEFISVFTGIYFYCISKKVDYLNLSTATLLPVEFNFIKVLKKKNIKVLFTVHDAQQFAVSYKRMSGDKRKAFYNMFDYIIVHNEFSKTYLEENFSVNSKVFLSFPFPPMDLAEINVSRYKRSQFERTFLFIGAFKKEKGYNVLLQAWQEIFGKNNSPHKAKLILAGELPKGIEFLVDKNTPLPNNVTIITRFLSDEEYIDFINNADIVVLPYIIGTNSAVLSTASSMGKAIIASDIPSLKTHPLVLEENIVQSNSVESLRDKIVEFLELTNIELEHKKKLQQEQFDKYTKTFNMQAQIAFKELT